MKERRLAARYEPTRGDFEASVRFINSRTPKLTGRKPPDPVVERTGGFRPRLCQKSLLR